jgi:hypothetical protein
LRVPLLLLRDFVPPLAGLALEAPDDLLAVPLRLVAPLDDLARELLDFFAPPLRVERFEAALRPPLEDFAPPLREEDELPRDDEVPPLLALALPSIVHLPDITR